MSDGTYALGDGWVLAGLVLFVAAALVCEARLWPAERRVQKAVAGSGGDATGSGLADTAVMSRAALVALALLLAGTVVMVAQP